MGLGERYYKFSELNHLDSTIGRKCGPFMLAVIAYLMRHDAQPELSPRERALLTVALAVLPDAPPQPAPTPQYQ